MITREFKLYLNAGVGVAPVINANQFDQDEEWIFTLLQSDGTVYTPSTGAIIGLKQDGTTILNAGTVNSDGQVVITETEQMTAVPGSNLFEILIDGNTHGTANFVVFVERRPGDIDHPSESDISLFQEAISAAGNVTQFQADIAELKSDVDDLEETDTSLASQIAQETSARTQQDAVLQAEIDQIIAPSGEAPSAAEVQNARIGVDGKTYDTLGNAIRGQVGDLKNAIENNIFDSYTDANKWVNGYWAIADGTVKTGTNDWLRTIEFISDNIVAIANNSALLMYLQAYEKDTGTYVGTWNGSAFTNVYIANTGVTHIDMQAFRKSYPNYNWHISVKEENGRNLSPSSDGILISFFTSVLANKVNKNGTDEVTPKNIDSKGYILGEIADDAITLNSCWYATGSGTIASGGARSGMDKAMINMSDMSGMLVFGFDSTVDYGTGQFTFGMSSSETSPYTRVMYFSKTEIVNSDYFEVNENIVTADIDALKNDYPTAVMLFVNIPHSVFILENQIRFRKSLQWLGNVVPAIVVAQDGSGDYKTITEAVSNATNGDTIYIKDGEYKETVIINKYVHLVGQSKQGTVLYQNIGDYNNCPLLITQGSVCNMTIKSLAPADTSGLTNYAYAIHLDKNFASEAKYQKCEIYNCDIYSEVNDAIGAGTNYASEYDIHDCFLHVSHNPVKTGACGFKCHNGQNQTTGKVTLKNNVIITEDANGTSCYDILYHNGGISNTQTLDILQVGNVLKYYRNNVPTIFIQNGYSYGNSVSAMNELS